MPLIDPKLAAALTKIGVENRKRGKVSVGTALMAGTFGTKAKTGRQPHLPNAAVELAVQTIKAGPTRPMTRADRRRLAKGAK